MRGLNLGATSRRESNRIRMAAWREKNRDRLIERRPQEARRAKEWRQAHPQVGEAYAALKRTDAERAKSAEKARKRRKQNPDKVREYERNRYHRTKETRRAQDKARRFGVSEAEIKQLLASHPVCDICQRPFARKRDQCIDHDHVTGKIRGVLCSNHNRALGLFEDNVNFLAAARDYLLGTS